MEQNEREKTNMVSIVAFAFAIALALIFGSFTYTISSDLTKEVAKSQFETLLMKYGPKNIREKLQEKEEAEAEERTRRNQERVRHEFIEVSGKAPGAVAIVRIGEHRYEIDSTGNILREVFD